MSKDAESFSSIEIKQLLESGDRENIFPFAGLTDNEDTISFLSFLEGNWDRIQETHRELPRDFKESRLFKAMISSESTQLVSQAIKEGNISVLKRFAGKKPTKSFDGIRSYEILEKKLRDKMVFYVFGGMGTGKTDFSLKLAEVWKKENPNKILLSNIRSFRQKDKLVEDWDELIREVKEENKDKEKFFVFDEGSNHLTGHLDQEKAVELAKKLKKFRKHDAKFLVIGHTGKDVHPEFRKLASMKIGSVIEKKEPKEAVFWESIRGGVPDRKVFELNDIPKTKYSYDTKEESEWSWGSLVKDEGEKEKSNKEKVLEIVKEIRERGVDGFLKPYKNKKAWRVRVHKIKKEFDANKELAYMVKEELIDREDIDYNIQ